MVIDSETFTSAVPDDATVKMLSEILQLIPEVPVFPVDEMVRFCAKMV
jgi:hypothetical protein